MLKPGSSYCVSHHALTHLVRGSKAETSELKRFNAIAKVVGGRMGGSGILGPSASDIVAIERRSLVSRLRGRWRPPPECLCSCRHRCA